LPTVADRSYAPLSSPMFMGLVTDGYTSTAHSAHLPSGAAAEAVTGGGRGGGAAEAGAHAGGGGAKGRRSQNRRQRVRGRVGGAGADEDGAMQEDEGRRLRGAEVAARPGGCAGGAGGVRAGGGAGARAGIAVARWRGEAATVPVGRVLSGNFGGLPATDRQIVIDGCNVAWNYNDSQVLGVAETVTCRYISYLIAVIFAHCSWHPGAGGSGDGYISLQIITHRCDGCVSFLPSRGFLLRGCSSDGYISLQIITHRCDGCVSFLPSRGFLLRGCSSVSTGS